MININHPTLLVGSTNRGKLRELQALLASLPVRLVLPEDAGIQLDVAETGATYAENAALKARAFCEASGLVTLADDSGLEVDALDGAPGLYSARYLPKPAASDADRREFLVNNLRGLPRPWTARFRCWAAVATPAGALELVEGAVEGEIIPEERGSGGFGYDPVFYMAEFGATMAELSEDVKNQVSHRARAIQRAIPVLKKLLNIE